VTIKGLPLILVAVPFLVGLLVCGAGGLYFACAVLDWAIERLLRSLDIYREFLAFAGPRVMARLARRKEESP
jgi:hypothetical protein